MRNQFREIGDRIGQTSRKLFSFHATRPVLLIRGLICFILGLLGIYEPVFVLTTATRIIGGVILCAGILALLIARNNRRAMDLIWVALLFLAGFALIFWPLFFDAVVMVAAGICLIVAALHVFLTVGRNTTASTIPVSGFLALIVGVILVAAPFAGVAAISWVLALLLLIAGAEMLLLALGLHPDKWFLS